MKLNQSEVKVQRLKGKAIEIDLNDLTPMESNRDIAMRAFSRGSRKMNLSFSRTKFGDRTREESSDTNLSIGSTPRVSKQPKFLSLVNRGLKGFPVKDSTPQSQLRCERSAENEGSSRLDKFNQLNRNLNLTKNFNLHIESINNNTTATEINNEKRTGINIIKKTNNSIREIEIRANREPENPSRWKSDKGKGFGLPLTRNPQPGEVVSEPTIGVLLNKMLEKCPAEMKLGMNMRSIYGRGMENPVSIKSILRNPIRNQNNIIQSHFQKKVRNEDSQMHPNSSVSSIQSAKKVSFSRNKIVKVYDIFSSVRDQDQK